MKISPEKSMISDMIMAVMGVDRLAYIKPVREDNEDNDGDISYVVFAADGTELASFESRDEAFMTIKRYNLTPVNIH